MKSPATLSPSLEDYLEAILDASGEGPGARPAAIAERLRVRRPSVTGALRTLAGRKLVCYEPYGAVRLTDRGRRQAEEVRRRHDVLSAFLRQFLGVPAARAEREACGMEHAISGDTIGRMEALMKDLRPAPPEAAP